MRKIKKINFKHNFGIYFSLLKRYKLLFISLLLIVLILQTSEVVNRYLFKILIDKGAEFAGKNIALPDYKHTLIILAIIFIAVSIFVSILKWLHIHFINHLDALLITDLKRKFFNHLISLSYKFHTSSKTGTLISRLIRGSGAIERLTDVIIFNTAPLIFQSIVVAISLLSFSWISSLIVVITVLSFISYSLFIQKIQEKANIKANITEDREKANISDIFTNIDSIKYFGKESGIKRKFTKIAKITKKALLHHWGYFRWLDSGQAAIIGVGTISLFYFAVMDLLNQKISIGTIVFIYTIYLNLLGPLFNFVHGIRDFYRAMADLEPLAVYGRITSEIKDKPNAPNLKIKEGNIIFNNVSFRYHRREIFQNFSLKINKDENIALIGPSGCGKTTLIRLLYRLYDVNEGEILIDNKNIKDFKQESLRSELSIVPQECVLFDDTIYNNILFSNPSASKEDVFKAIKFAQLDKVIKDMPKKENTIVGERGIKLSGGEKQRVSIARALLADKKILVLDEATSSLDSETERDIQRDLDILMKDRTSILIAHRLSTIMKADRIVVLDKGKIVQIGNHKQLIRERGLYRRLWNIQKKGFIK